MIEAETRIATLTASEILTSVATGWEHRFPTRYDAITAEVELDRATLVMTADGDSLSLRVTAEDVTHIDAAKRTIAEHVDRSAGDHGPYVYDWITN